MKLYISSASPFARKVRLVAHEAGLAPQVEEVPTVVSPVKPNADLAKANPLMKLPTLVTDDGMALFDSPVICEYLDSLNTGRKLFPAAGPARWAALRQQAVADGILDAAIGVRYQTALAPKELQWTQWQDGQRAKWKQALDFLEADAKALDEDLKSMGDDGRKTTSTIMRPASTSSGPVVLVSQRTLNASDARAPFSAPSA
jgi:glutathione S-transferase